MSVHSILKRGFWQIFKGRPKPFGSYEIVNPGKVGPKREVLASTLKPEYWLTGEPSSQVKYPDIKSPKDIEGMRVSCQLASGILHALKSFVKEGVTTDEIDAFVHEECLKSGAYPSPLNYRNYPKSVCTSVNNVACHGVPDDRPLRSGDSLNIDITVYKNGYHGDCSAMYLVGEVDERGRRLCEVTLEALEEAVKTCRPGLPFSSIGALIEEIATSNDFVVLPCFIGHGIGTYFHGPPDIYHFNAEERLGRASGRMEEGMTFTIEPVLGEGSEGVVVLEDGWTAVTEDGSRAAQWEHTVLLARSGAIPLTAPLPPLLG